MSDDPVAYEPEKAMAEVASMTHHMPRHWRGRAHTSEVQRELSGMFQLKIQLFLEEMLSVALTPYILYYVMPPRVGDIVAFVADNTVEVEGVGSVCSMAVFDLSRHGNAKYGSSPGGSSGSSKTSRSRQGKVEKSLLTFIATYPTWEPPAGAKALLANMNRCSLGCKQGVAHRDGRSDAHRRPLSDLLLVPVSVPVPVSIPVPVSVPMSWATYPS